MPVMAPCRRPLADPARLTGTCCPENRQVPETSPDRVTLIALREHKILCRGQKTNDGLLVRQAPGPDFVMSLLSINFMRLRGYRLQLPRHFLKNCAAGHIPPQTPYIVPRSSTGSAQAAHKRTHLERGCGGLAPGHLCAAGYSLTSAAVRRLLAPGVASPHRRSPAGTATAAAEHPPSCCT